MIDGLDGYGELVKVEGGFLVRVTQPFPKALQAIAEARAPGVSCRNPQLVEATIESKEAQA